MIITDFMAWQIAEKGADSFTYDERDDFMAEADPHLESLQKIAQEKNIPMLMLAYPQLKIHDLPDKFTLDLGMLVMAHADSNTPPGDFIRSVLALSRNSDLHRALCTLFDAYNAEGKLRDINTAGLLRTALWRVFKLVTKIHMAIITKKLLGRQHG